MARPVKRPEALEGKTVRIRSGCGNIYVTVNMLDGAPCEVFLHTAKSGGCIAAFTEAVGRLVSTALRAGVEVDEIVEQLQNIRCPKPVLGGALSCPDAVSKALKMVLGKEDQKPASPSPQVQKDPGTVKVGLNPECPNCGAELAFVEGCAKCPACGYSECG